MRYLPPGLPAPSLPAPTANTYRQPASPLQQAPQPSPPEPPQASEQNNPHHALLAAWRLRHGDAWIRADALHPAVRHMIDARDRTAAIRQKLRQLAATHRELETKTVGNRAKPVALYRLITPESAEGLEG